MSDFAAARLNMVTSQIRTSDVTDPRIQNAMSEVPREIFVPEHLRGVAYASQALPVGAGRGLMEPRSFAKLAQAADIGEHDVALVIGAGTGYGTAVLARLAEAVVALEEDQALAAQATTNLAKLGVDNAAVVTGMLSRGCPEQAPFDVIFIDGGVEFVPKGLFDQLKDGGRLAAIVLEGSLGKGRIFTRHGDAVSMRTVFDGGAPLLPVFARAREFSF
jgi:protein-L-isoaspartate(D-aspartate) O-methyltransferase